jgi:periplasmic copper chaperone A
MLLAALVLFVTNVTSHPAFGTGVVYATIRNTSSVADALVGAQTSIGAASLHISMAEKAGAGMGGTMSMMPVSEIRLPPHATVMLKPGGYHVMIENLTRPLRAGQTFAIRLHFQREGWITETCTVQPF